MNKYPRAVLHLARALATSPVEAAIRTAWSLPFACAAGRFARRYTDRAPGPVAAPKPPAANALADFFRARTSGRGVWKWEHYFDAYHRHLARFVGRPVHLLEIGIYSGGSLEMWRAYLGADCRITGVDVEPACRAYEDERTTVLIGDQADREFWRRAAAGLGGLDVVVDDGGHTPEQQQATLEELLPLLRPGGVFICEDVHGTTNRFAAYAAGLVDELNRADYTATRPPQCAVSGFQAAIHSIHFYPFMVVIEKHDRPPERLVAPKHGTEWQPFL